MPDPIDPTPGTPPPEPTPPPPPAAAGMTAQQAESLMARLEKLETARPASMKDQLAEALGLKADAVEQRKEGRDVADAVEKQIAAMQTQLRAAQIKAAATKFSDPDLVAEMLTGRDGEVEDLVKALAERAPGLLAKPVGASADLGGGQAATGGGAKTGRDALIAEIEAAQAGSPYK